MSLTIQQIGSLARRTLRGDFLAMFSAQAKELAKTRDATIGKQRWEVIRKHGPRGKVVYHRELADQEKLIRIECRVALAALYARLYQEQEAQRAQHT